MELTRKQEEGLKIAVQRHRDRELGQIQSQRNIIGRILQIYTEVF